MEVTERVYALLDTAAQLAAEHYDRTPIDRIVCSATEMALTCCQGPVGGGFDNVSNAIESLEKDLAELEAYLKEDTETRRWRLAVAIDDYLWLTASTPDEYSQGGGEKSRDEVLRYIHETIEDVLYGEFWKEYVPDYSKDSIEVVTAYKKMVQLINEWMGE